jgi:hypothetical protein
VARVQFARANPAEGDAVSEAETSEYRTAAVEGVWYSIAPSVLPPDDRPGWVDLHRHQEEGTIVLGRFRGVAAAVDRAWRQYGVAPSAWQRATESG